MTDQELFAMFDDYQLGRGLAATTRRRRAISLRSFARFLAPRTVTTTKPGDVDKWLAGFRTPASKAAYYGDLGAFFKWAHRRDVVAINPMSLTDPPKKPRHLPRPCKAEVIPLAVAMAKNGQTQLMILLGALAGLRVSEIAALASEDIFLDHEPPVLLVRHGKGGRDRIVPLHPTLQERLRGVDHGYLFPSRNLNREHIAGREVGRYVGEALCAASDGQHVTAHQLRHYFGTEVAKWSRGNIILTAGLMGHASRITTMGYVGWTPTDGAEVVGRIGGGGRAEVRDDMAGRRKGTGAAS